MLLQVIRMIATELEMRMLRKKEGETFGEKIPSPSEMGLFPFEKIGKFETSFIK